MDRNACNRPRFVADERGGHYESWFQRANHPTRPLAFWIRYTVFSPRGQPEDAVGELWAIYFDGERGEHLALKQELPIAACRFAPDGLDLRIGDALLRDGHLQGGIDGGARGSLSWSLDYAGTQAPLLLMPEPLYERGFPKAKVLVGTPLAAYRGELRLNQRRIAIDGWVGSQNHNWGSRHTDSYAWGQVAGFDGAPDAFLECSTARLRLGPCWTPPLTVMVLRLDGHEHRLNSLARAWRVPASYEFPHWQFVSRAKGLRIEMRMQAPRSAFVALAYANPPGGVKTCLNTKLADCELQVEQAGRPTRRLLSRQRAAFEILTDRQDHGLPISC